jgi:hypothetical protein
LHQLSEEHARRSFRELSHRTQSLVQIAFVTQLHDQVDVRGILEKVLQNNSIVINIRNTNNVDG